MVVKLPSNFLKKVVIKVTNDHFVTSDNEFVSLLDQNAIDRVSHSILLSDDPVCFCS